MFYRKSSKKKSNRKSDYVSHVSNESFKKLASTNVKKSMKDYLIYFITLVFGVALLYTFNSLDDNLAMLNGNNLLDSYIYFSRGIVAGFSVLICIIFGFLITYANNFLMKKRKKEFGIYTTLGMDKRDINKLMFKETIIIGTFSLIVGLIIGIFASQGISIITFKMLGLSSSEFKFSLSIASIIKTVLFFGLVLLLVNKFNKKTIKKNSLIDLLNSSKKNEMSVAKGKKSHIIIFLLSILLTLSSYFILLTIRQSVLTFSVCIILMTLGIYLFFMSVSDFIILRFKKHKSRYYKNLNIFVVNQVSSRIKTMGMSITVICLLLFISMMIMPFGMSISNYIIGDLKEATPYDVTLFEYVYKGDEFIRYSTGNNDLNSKVPSIKDTLIKNNFPLESFASNTSELRLYSLENINISDFTSNTSELSQDSDTNLYIVPLSDYNASRKQRGLKEINLKDDEFAINCTVENIKPIYKNYIKNQPKSIEVNSKKLNLNQSDLYTSSYSTDQVLMDNGTLVVPDKVLSNLNPVKTILNINYKKAGNETENKFISTYSNYRYKLSDFQNYMINYKSVIDGEKISLNVALSSYQYI
ncbi:FtsX-like permease family protein [[Clostridium] dakarense]|uniref:FtsX-like permease family protein n=1 Tax=Faecalimicrobium dakarense TaxID=1301100 RepID=UPI0004AF83A3|nr:ABC transporter permease [[Clostridium] dakarense]